jgi:ribose 5-phosphate isomerase A
MDQAAKKKQAALAALEFIRPGMSLGVGTGSTVNYLIDALPAVARGLSAVVASSQATESRLEANGIPVRALDEVGDLDLYIDGADEANAQFHLVKGGGGALTREKVLAGASRRFVCIIDDSKWVDVLGRFPLPVEVIPMARSFVARQFVRLGGRPVWRQDFVTDNGNQIIDIHDLRITDPVDLEARINQLPGVVTVGLFAARPADVLLIAGSDGTRRLDRP